MGSAVLAALLCFARCAVLRCCCNAEVQCFSAVLCQAACIAVAAPCIAVVLVSTALEPARLHRLTAASSQFVCPPWETPCTNALAVFEAHAGHTLAGYLDSDAALHICTAIDSIATQLLTDDDINCCSGLAGSVQLWLDEEWTVLQVGSCEL